MSNPCSIIQTSNRLSDRLSRGTGSALKTTGSNLQNDRLSRGTEFVHRETLVPDQVFDLTEIE